MRVISKLKVKDYGDVRLSAYLYEATLLYLLLLRIPSFLIS